MLCIRLPQEVIDLLTERGTEFYGPGGKGASGGASRLARVYIYQGLGLAEPPPEWGEKDSESARYQRRRREHLRIAAYLRENDRFALRTTGPQSPGSTRIRDKKTGEELVVYSLEELRAEEARRDAEEAAREKEAPQ